MWYSCHLPFSDSSYFIPFFKRNNSFSEKHFFFIMETFYFIYGSGLSLRLFMVILSSIPTSFFTFYDGGLYVFYVISLPSCLFIVPIPFTSSIDNAPFGIKLLIVKNSFPIIWQWTKQHGGLHLTIHNHFHSNQLIFHTLKSIKVICH